MNIFCLFEDMLFIVAFDISIHVSSAFPFPVCAKRQADWQQVAVISVLATSATVSAVYLRKLKSWLLFGEIHVCSFIHLISVCVGMSRLGIYTTMLKLVCEALMQLWAHDHASLVVRLPKLGRKQLASVVRVRSGLRISCIGSRSVAQACLSL